MILELCSLKMADFLTISFQKSGIYFPQPGPSLFSTNNKMLRPVPKFGDISEQLNSQQNQRTSVIVWSPPTTPTHNFMPPSPPQTPTTPKGTPVNEFSPKSPNVVPPRGRPRADVLNILMEEGQNSYSSIRCDVCNRVFPREKSLQAHKRTHSGERPYVCDFPNCGKAFVQSGQLKTHQRLHTGEKPFACTAEGCTTRFTHANRHCSLHPYAGLKRTFTEIPLKEILKNENSEPNEYKAAVLKWLANYEMEKDERNPTKLEERVLKRKLEKEIARQQIVERKKSRIEARKRMADARERWYGAMALVELADSQLNCNWIFDRIVVFSFQNNFWRAKFKCLQYFCNWFSRGVNLIVFFFKYHHVLITTSFSSPHLVSSCILKVFLREKLRFVSIFNVCLEKSHWHFPCYCYAK